MIRGEDKAHARGLDSFVRDEFGQITRCAIRQVLHDVATDQRHPVSAGDWVQVQGRVKRLPSVSLNHVAVL